jgi:hypothetical protein
MAAKRRSGATSHYPQHLIRVKHRGMIRYRFKTIDGTLKMFPPGTTEIQAIQAALAYNAKHRNSLSTFNLESNYYGVTGIKNNDKFNKPLREWLPIVINRVQSEESLSDSVFKQFVSECKKLDRALGDAFTKSITLATINDFINVTYPDTSKRNHNKKISNLRKIFSYLADESAVESNFLLNKKLKKVTKEDFIKTRCNLTPTDFEKIYAAAPLFLKVAMSLSLQTTHAVREIHRIKYKIDKPKEGACGIVWLEQPIVDNGVTIHGTLYIHREKVKKSASSYVAIPVTDAIKEIVELSKTDRIHCPYIVHRVPGQTKRGIAEGCDHHYQVHHQYISKGFSKVRDSIGLYSDIDITERPTYHEIRGLSARLIEQMGQSATIRMAHANAKTTKIYTGTQDIKWNEATPITVKIR